MADYYYARVRTYLSTQSDGLTASNLKNNKLKANPIICADASADGKSKKQYVWYVVDVYRTPVSNFDLWKTLSYDQLGTLLENTNERKVDVDLPYKDTKYTNQTDVNYYCRVGSISHIDGHMEFTISNNLGLPRSITPLIKIYKQEYASSTWDRILNVWWDNSTKKQQTIKFTGAGGAPAYPESAKYWLQKASPDGPSVGATKAAAAAYAKENLVISGSGWSICNKLWYYTVVDNKEGSVTLWSSDESGITFKMVLGKKDSFLPEPSRPKINAWNDKNGAAYKKAMDASVCKDGSKAEVPTVDPTIGADFNVEVIPPKDAGRWNPPPHVASRSVPYSVRSPYDINILNPELSTFSGIQDLASSYSTTGERVYGSKGYSYLERGRIFQDALSAEVLNQTNTGGKPPGPNESNQWGFRFMYNPTSFSYSTAANNSIDWTLGSKDTAALLAGNQTVQLQLYLNRVVDLSYLNAIYGRTNTATVERQLSVEASYGRPLSPDEIDGIMNRGTEYDLEFLYRCLTGDPQTNNPLLNDKLRKKGSADIGYITGIPLWLYLNDNLRYFGSVSGFEVNHLIFNTEMVPTLSVVTLSFGRYPAQFANDKESLKAVRDNFFPPANE
jgi:hypothetical protein